ncbi:MAG TPA: hypothetical protein VLH86_00205, partial [Patescibacteria group bacterium]|nr:hypothetical protein [Patescibacteria group bacterium]
AVVLAAYLGQIIEVLYWILSQWPDNHNLSAFLVIRVSGIVLPGLFFAAAYCTVPKTAGRQSAIFESALLAVVGVALTSLVTQVSLHVYQQFITLSGGYWQSVLYTLSGSFLAAAIYFVALIYLSRKNNL